MKGGEDDIAGRAFAARGETKRQRKMCPFNSSAEMYGAFATAARRRTFLSNPIHKACDRRENRRPPDPVVSRKYT